MGALCWCTQEESALLISGAVLCFRRCWAMQLAQLLQQHWLCVLHYGMSWGRGGLVGPAGASEGGSIIRQLILEAGGCFL